MIATRTLSSPCRALPLGEAIRSSGDERLLADVQYALDDGQPDGGGQDVEPPLEPAPGREDHSRGDHDHALRARAQPDVAAQPERLGAGPRVADEERACDAGDRGRERDGVA